MFPRRIATYHRRNIQLYFMEIYWYIYSNTEEILAYLSGNRNVVKWDRYFNSTSVAVMILIPWNIMSPQRTVRVFPQWNIATSVTLWSYLQYTWNGCRTSCIRLWLLCRLSSGNYKEEDFKLNHNTPFTEREHCITY